jgi:hypothetical protein
MKCHYVKIELLLQPNLRQHVELTNNSQRSISYAENASAPLRKIQSFAMTDTGREYAELGLKMSRGYARRLQRICHAQLVMVRVTATMNKKQQLLTAQASPGVRGWRALH